MVVLGSGLVFMVTIGPIGSFGLIFGTFLENIEAGTSDVTFINGLYFALGLLPGVLANRILHLYTCRQVTIFGGIFYFLGCFLSAFSSSVAYLVVTFGIVQGTGFGLLLPAAFTCLNHYFLRRRTLAMGVAQLMAAVGVMLYPLLIEVLLENYGFRGTQAVLAALSLHIIVGAITMKPLDSSELFVTRKTWERSIEDTLRRKSIISIKSLRLKPDEDEDMILKNILGNSKFSEIPSWDERPHLNMNCVTKIDTVMEDGDEETICETKLLLNKHEQSCVQNSVRQTLQVNVPKNRTFGPVKPAETRSNLETVPSRSDMDIIMSGKDDKVVSNALVNFKALNYSVNSHFHENKSRLIEKLKDGTYSSKSHQKKRKSLDFVKNVRQSQGKVLPIQSNLLEVTNCKINSSLPNMMVNNYHELNSRKCKSVRNGMDNETDGNMDKGLDYDNKLTTNSKLMSNIGRHSETDHDILDKSREGAQHTGLNNGVTLEVPTIDVLAATDSEKEGSVECIKRSSSEKSLSKNNPTDPSQQHLTSKVNSFDGDPGESNLNNTSSMTAFTKDFPNYHKTFNRSRFRDQKEYMFYSHRYDHAPHNSLEYFDKKLTKSNSVSHLTSIYIDKHTESDQIGNPAFRDASGDNCSHHNSHEKDLNKREDPHRVHPCFYDGSSPSDEDTENVTASLLEQNTKTNVSSSFEFLPRFPSSARAEACNNRLPVVKISDAQPTQDKIEDDGSESLSFGISEDSEPRPPTNRSRRQSVISWTADCMDLGLMKDVIYVNIIIGVSFVLFSDNMFFNLQPLYYLSLGLQGSEVAVCIAINSAADLLGRVCFVISSSWLTYKSRLIFLLASVGTVLFRIGFLVVYDFQMICLMTAFLGFFRSWISVCIPLIFAEYSTVDRFPAAYGLHLLTAGFVHLLIGPFVGLIRDVSGSYPACLGTVTGCLLFCVVPWIAEAILFRRSTVLSISN